MIGFFSVYYIMQKSLSFFKFRQNIAQISNLGDEIARLVR